MNIFKKIRRAKALENTEHTKIIQNMFTNISKAWLLKIFNESVGIILP